MKIFFLLFTILSTAGILSGQKPTPKPMPTPPLLQDVRVTLSEPVTNAKSANCFYQQSVDVAVTKFPAKFHGHDIYEIAAALNARKNITKDEFETTLQFMERKAKEQDKPLLGSLNVTSYLMLGIKGVFEYDADKEQMSVLYEIAPLQPLEQPLCNSSTAAYKASPRLVVFDRIAEPTKDKRIWTNSFSVKLAEARELKPKLRLLLIARLESPPLSRYKNINSASPYFFYAAKEIIDLKLEGFWVYDISSGGILAKYPITFAEIAPPKSPEPTSSASLSDAEKLVRNGQYDDAMSIIRKILSNEPMSAESYLLAGKIYLRRGDIDAALSAFKTAVFWESRLIDAYISIGNIYVSKGDCLLAKSYSVSAMQIDSNNSEAKALQELTEKCRR